MKILMMMRYLSSKWRVFKSYFQLKMKKNGEVYGAGWEDAVCYIMDNYIIEDRNGKPIEIGISINIDEDEIIKKLMEKKDEK